MTSSVSSRELADGVTIEKSGLAQWVSVGNLPTSDSIGQRCTVERIRAALSEIENAEVVSATVSRSGKFTPPPPQWVPQLAPDPGVIRDLPEFCDIRVDHHLSTGRTAHIRVWVPLAWNGRLLATGGMGSVTGPLWFTVPVVRTITMPWALRNGFATAATDAGNQDERFFEWPLDRETGTLDMALMRSWAYQGTHEMAIIAKAVVEALTGTPPRHSYYAGCSGGGRQGIASAQHHPADFDGIWASDPGIAWSKIWIRGIWPALVMKEYQHPLPAAKFEAFKSAFIQACDGVDGVRDGLVGAFDEVSGFDPDTLVGTPTDAGDITPLDVEIAQKIWDGPRRRDGRRLTHGFRPDTTIWNPPNGFASLVEVDGKLVSDPIASQAYFRWVTEDLDFDWSTLTIETFIDLAERGLEKFAEINSDDPDLSELRDSGGKLLISQAAADDTNPCEEVVSYYGKVAELLGGVERVSSFVRLFVTDGDIHGTLTGAGPGLSMATAMAALMAWVEQGDAPDALVAERADANTGEVVATRPVYPYPSVTRYSGHGPIGLADSYVEASVEGRPASPTVR